MPSTLAIDFGARYIGIALVEHPAPRQNRVLYAATVSVEARPLNALAEARVQSRRLRRSRKTHRRRLRRLADALAGVPNAEQLLCFCRRRGFSHDDDKEGESGDSFHVHRSGFFEALRQEVDRLIDPAHKDRVIAACARHLNESCKRSAEPRPARFDNRGPSRCNWQGCTRNVPKAGNAVACRVAQALAAWLAPVFQGSADPARLRRGVEYWARRFEALARENGGATDKEARKPVNARIARVCEGLLARLAREAATDAVEAFREHWTEHYRKALLAIVREGQGGRVRFCRDHSRAYVDHLLAGEVPPLRQDVTEADLVSRKQQIVFRRLWRLVEARLLPLAGGRIDTVVVERVAFDILAGPFKARQELSPDRACELYWRGPQFGFASRMDMLKAEFAGRCAYCTDRAATDHVEHLLPRSAFPFDSYFNLLPACAACNARKGARTAVQAGMTVSAEAYAAYCDYVRRQPVPHVFHTIKKGLLNLLTRPATADEAERRVSMLVVRQV